MSDSRYVQYGCGWSAPAGWRNFDASPTLRLERLPLIGRFVAKNAARFPDNVEFGDIVKGLPVAPGSCEGVYCSHVLEHLSLDAFRSALRNTYTLLRPGGTFRCVLPDLENLVKQYLGNPASDAATRFMRDAHLGQESEATSPMAFMTAWLGKSRHLWMWDYKSIQAELERARFVGVRRASFGDTADPRFHEVEERDRWDDCLGVECTRRA